MNRRQFGKVLSIGLLALYLPFAVGCNVMQTILNWVPVGLAALDTILTLLDGMVGAASQAIIMLIKAAFAQLQIDIADYQKINPPPAGALNKVIAALQVIVNNFQQLLASTQMPDGPLLMLVSALVQVVLGTILGFENLLNQQSKAKVSLVGDTFHIGGRSYPVKALTPKVSAFKKSWNSACDAGKRSDLKLKLSLKEHLDLA